MSSPQFSSDETGVISSHVDSGGHSPNILLETDLKTFLMKELEHILGC